MNAYIVVGANFGDEGKGHVTNFLASTSEDPIVVRFNGGAQAGHTVVHNGHRKVFHHFGSGTLANVPTFLTQDFIVNPLFFNSEWDELSALGYDPDMFVDMRARLTTPFDIIINLAVELSRGIQRHGSCGAGINETIQRTEYRNGVYSLLVENLLDQQFAAKQFQKIQRTYFNGRVKRLGIEKRFVDEATDLFNSLFSIDEWLDQAQLFLSRVLLSVPRSIVARQHKTVIFEGAQGLLLDEDHYWFPHVTHSHTGIRNCIDILHQLRISQAEVLYVTRSYLTRHGNGPLPFEHQGKIYDGIIDETNIPNMFQGTLRFAPLNLDLLKESITNDLAANKSYIQLTPTIVITCYDQLPSTVQYVENGVVKLCEKSELLNKVTQIYRFEHKFMSQGPQAKDISLLKI